MEISEEEHEAATDFFKVLKKLGIFKIWDHKGRVIIARETRKYSWKLEVR